MPDFPPAWFAPLCLTLLGACIGSFLNVVIYRSPLGLSLHHPKRSFCPQCKSPIAWHHNIPLISWLALGGKCASCKKHIPARYWLVEALTAGMFLAVGLYFVDAPVYSLLPICIWIAVAVAIGFIDAETMMVFPRHALLGAFSGMAAAALHPPLVNAPTDGWLDGLACSAIGAAAGFVMIWIVIELGKKLFGSWRHNYEASVPWSIREPESDTDEISLILPDRACPWSELFNRESDRAIFHDARLVIDGSPVQAETVFLYHDRLETDDGLVFKLEEIQSVEGSLVKITASREAMGSGDAWVMLMVGALCGWEGSLFTLVGGSLIGILYALFAKTGVKHMLPFGPCLLIAAIIWLFGGNCLWDMYLDWITG